VRTDETRLKAAAVSLIAQWRTNRVNLWGTKQAPRHSMAKADAAMTRRRISSVKAAILAKGVIGGCFALASIADDCVAALTRFRGPNPDVYREPSRQLSRKRYVDKKYLYSCY